MDSFYTYKQRAIERIERDREIGYLDPDIYDLLKKIIEHDKLYPQSSCSGRIIMVNGRYQWKRSESNVIYKHHFYIRSFNIKNFLYNDLIKDLWLIAQGPIMHIYTYDYDSAFKLIESVRKIGYKHSGIFIKNEKGVLVEIQTGIRSSILLKADGRVVINEFEIENITNVANDILNKAKLKLKELYDMFNSAKFI
ncbi:MAG: tRNA(Phe) 7-((3-amino-3-carboxypropyl)-4-demethylwyosine(37)-N(4))-methyltransferase [Candidatus Micrarchaeota archaeon]|nr:MAG: tRNA(Phe) 7-((3-amino-3-carboxypropyl)-4-demethylwyosine(37)-N(4))-methyltransferase [Candidatus Micrarchaeota archaeon]